MAIITHPTHASRFIAAAVSNCAEREIKLNQHNVHISSTKLILDLELSKNHPKVQLEQRSIHLLLWFCLLFWRSYVCCIVCELKTTSRDALITI